jgi:hypothetical protein
VLVFGVCLDYFVFIFNGSDLLAVSGRDKDATWRTLGTLCRERDWSRPRLFRELQNGLRTRTFPEGHVINWHDLNVRHALNVEASTLPFGYVSASGMGTADSSWAIQEPIGIEVLPPDAPADAEAPAPPANAPAASPAPPKKISEADVRDAVLAIVREHPQGSPPLDEGSLHKEVERRVEMPLARERVLAARNEVAPHFKLPVGRPRKNAQ